MALINQSGMYNGSAPLNPLPYVNIALQQRARKQAREEAIDTYYKKLPDTINDKGVRDQEIPIINDYKNKIYDFGLKNREALRNPKVDNGAAQLNLQKLMREAAGVARMSQNAAKVDLEAGKFFLSKDNQYALNSDEYVLDHELHNLPVTDPRHKTIDLQKYATNRPFDQSGFIKEIKTVIPFSEKVSRQTDPTDPNYEVVTTTPVLNNDSKEKIVSYAADKFHNDPTFRKKIANDLAGTGQLPELMQIAKEQFGVKDASEMTDELLAAAYTYSQLPIAKTKEKVQANYTNRTADKNAEWNRRTAQNQRNSLIKIAANKPNGSGVNGTSGNALDEFGTVEPIYFKSGGKIENGVVFDKDGNLYNGEMVIPKDNLPANVTVSLSTAKIPLSKFMNIIVKDGSVQSIKTKNGEVSRQAMENLQKKANTEPIKAPQPVYGNSETKKQQPKVTTGYSRAELKAGGWTDDQINKAVKAGKIKLK